MLTSTKQPPPDAICDPDEWVDRHGDALFRFAFLRVNDRETAEEMVQETFVSALRTQTSFSQQSSERTWLIGILKHKLIDHYRRTGAECNRIDCAGTTPDQTFDERGLWRIGPKPWRRDPAAGLETAEFWQVFRECMARLPQGMGEAFRLHEVECLGGHEVCDLLDISQTSLWAHLHRARLRLRHCLEKRWFRRRTERNQ